MWTPLFLNPSDDVFGRFNLAALLRLPHLVCLFVNHDQQVWCLLANPVLLIDLHGRAYRPMVTIGGACSVESPSNRMQTSPVVDATILHHFRQLRMQCMTVDNVDTCLSVPATYYITASYLLDADPLSALWTNRDTDRGAAGVQVTRRLDRS